MKYLHFLDVIKQKIQSCSADDLFEVLVYFVSGFILGLVIKYSIRYFLWFLIFSIVSLWTVQNFGIISFNHEYFKEFISLAQDYTISDIINSVMNFVQCHIGESLGLVFGCYLSWEIL